MIDKARVFFYGILLVGGLFGASFYMARSQDFYRANGSDFFSLWLAPHMLLTGQDPYEATAWVSAHDTFGAQWVSDPTFLYPLPLAVILIPFGVFSLDAAAVLWVTLSLVMIIVSVYSLIKSWQPKRLALYLLPALAGISIFRPTFLTWIVGQIEPLLLICLVGTALCWQKQAWLKGGVLASMVLLKPQVGLPLLALLGVWLIVRRCWAALVGMGVGCLGLLALGMVFNPGWLWRWLSIGQGKVAGVFRYSPTLWGVAATVCRHGTACTSWMGGWLVLLVVAGSFYFLLRRKALAPLEVVGTMIAVALLVTPYLWAYTQILLLIPILVTMGFLHRRGLPYLVVATFPLAMAVLAFVLLFVAVSIDVDVWSAVVPLVSLILLVALS